MSKLTTSLAAIYKAWPRREGCAKLRNHLGKTAQEAKTDTAEFSLEVVLDSNGLDDALWVLDNVIKNRRIISLFSADCAERVHHLFAAVMPDDDRPMNAINVARSPSATDEDRADARADASSAAWAAAQADAQAAAEADAWVAAWAAAWAAARADARSAAWAAAQAAARADAEAAAEASQKDRLRQYIQHGEAAADLAWGGSAK